MTRSHGEAARAPGRSTGQQPAPAVPAHEDIARRAYELFLESGGEHGRDAANWLKAEQELLAALARKVRNRAKRKES